MQLYEKLCCESVNWIHMITGFGLITGSCEYGYELSVSIYSGEFHNQLHDYNLLTKDPDLQSVMCVLIHCPYCSCYRTRNKLDADVARILCI
jgi:hypothetical protein